MVTTTMDNHVILSKEEGTYHKTKKNKQGMEVITVNMLHSNLGSDEQRCVGGCCASQMGSFSQ